MKSVGAQGSRYAWEEWFFAAKSVRAHGLPSEEIPNIAGPNPHNFTVNPPVGGGGVLYGSWIEEILYNAATSGAYRCPATGCNYWYETPSGAYPYGRWHPSGLSYDGENADWYYPWGWTSESDLVGGRRSK